MVQWVLYQKSRLLNISLICLHFIVSPVQNPFFKVYFCAFYIEFPNQFFFRHKMEWKIMVATFLWVLHIVVYHVSTGMDQSLWIGKWIVIDSIKNYYTITLYYRHSGLSITIILGYTKHCSTQGGFIQRRSIKAKKCSPHLAQQSGQTVLQKSRRIRIRSIKNHLLPNWLVLSETEHTT